MADVLELKDGSFVTPINVFDVLDVVEEYIGTDTRQYLEECFISENIIELDKDDSLFALKDHYSQVLMNIDDVAEELEKKMQEKQMSRDAINGCIQRIRSVVRREKIGSDDDRET